MDDALLVEALAAFERQGISQHKPCINAVSVSNKRAPLLRRKSG
jgi:hypothetical protein